MNENQRMHQANELETRFINAKRALFDKLYGFLNENQREAVYTVNGPLLVLAGAGSGKTTVLVNRIAQIIRFGNAFYDEKTPENLDEEAVSALEKALSGDEKAIADLLCEYASAPCPPWAVLAITFTNKAAKEIKQRLGVVVGEENGATDVWAGTFHSVCVRILRKYGSYIGLESDFTIYDSDDSKKVAQLAMKELNIDEKMLSAKVALGAISKAKDKLILPEEFTTLAGRDFRLGQVGRIYSLYQKKLEEANAVDFDDIILKTVKLLEESEEVRNYYQRRFKYVCIDEYQDTNYAQFTLSALLSGGYKNLMVVGDDDQSIYRFRGATVENILNFDKTFPQAKVVKLEQNYRSTDVILDAANAVIHNNEGRHEKTLWTNRKDGEKIQLCKLPTQIEEGKHIVDEIQRLCKTEKYKFKDFAILYRMNAQSNSLEKTFARSGISYRILGGTRFYDRKEIKDILAYLCLVNNTGDNLRLRRIINEPKRKIGNTTIQAIEDIAAQENISYYDVVRNCDKYVALAKSAEKLKEFAKLIEDLKKIAESSPLSELFRKATEITGYRAMLVSGGEADKDKIENIDELVSNAVEYETGNSEATLRGFLEEVALVADVDNYDKDSDSVVLMTIHSAKGLEFPVVFLPGMETGIFPLLSAESVPDELEEERRLAYVAITRAKDRLYMLHTSERILFGMTQHNKISKYVTEIPEKLFECHNISSESTDDYGYARVNYAARAKTINQDYLGAMKAKANEKQKTETFACGDTVSHMTFGEGTVLSAKEMSGDVLYEIAFENVGTKKLMGNYARLKKVE